jgi:hypothetical protein
MLSWYPIAAYVQPSNVVVATGRAEKDSQKQNTAIMQGATKMQNYKARNIVPYLQEVDMLLQNTKAHVIIYLGAIAHFHS